MSVARKTRPYVLMVAAMLALLLMMPSEVSADRQ